MATGMNFQESCELKLAPRAGADRAFFEAAQLEQESMFPMPLNSVVGHLRSRGYDCRAESLRLLLDEGVVRPASISGWSQSEVDTAAEYFEDCGILTPYAQMCETLGCRYSDFVRALREAAERETLAHGQEIPADDQYFVMHRVPPRGVTSPDGDFVDIKPAVISFTLADDIRQRLERGEEV